MPVPAQTITLRYRSMNWCGTIKHFRKRIHKIVERRIYNGKNREYQCISGHNEPVQNNDRIRESVHNSAEGQKLILEEDAIVESDKNRYKEKARITVSAKRTFEAASRYKNTKTAVHNFASASNPGGGGSVVQMLRKSAYADVPGCLSA